MGDCEFSVTISKGSFEFSMYFYGNVGEWMALGKQLTTFPLNIADQARFEIGSQSSLIHLALNAYCYDEKRHTALGVIMGKNDGEPHRYRFDFSIPAEVASINQLGQCLLNWKVENGSEIIWEVQTS